MTSAQTPASSTASDTALALRHGIEQALAFGGRPVYRLGSARTSVRFVIDGHAACATTVLLDRHPPEVVDGDEPAEVTIVLTAAQADLFLCGRMILPNELAAGTARWHGPVRRYLRIDPILRGLLKRGQEAGRSRGRS